MTKAKNMLLLLLVPPALTITYLMWTYLATAITS